MSLGAEVAGIDVKYAVDVDSHSAATYRANFPQTTFIEKDVSAVTGADFDTDDIPFVVFGGAPCQGFSTSNQRTRNSQNTKNWLYKEFVRIVKETRPTWVVFENVKGFLETENGLFFRSLIENLKNADYHVDHAVLNAKNFGVPQDRTRLFVVGRRGTPFAFPTTLEELPPVTVKEAIGDLPSLENGASIDFRKYRPSPPSTYAKELRGKLKSSGNHLVTKSNETILQRYKSVPQGGNWENIPEHMMTNYKDRNRCHTGIYHRLPLNKPSSVIGNYRKNMLIHPVEDRGLSVREAARIQSFPDSFYFVGSIGFQQQQVANAVPPKLACFIFSLILALDNSKI